jgi:hypothetical protein
MRAAILFMLCLFVAGSCTSPDSARKALEAQGFTDIDLRGWSPLSCSDSDDTSTGFRARNTNGQIVEGVVCCTWAGSACGLGKGCTIRW